MLLQLIERRELDITAVSVALVADQFLTRVRAMAELPGDDLAAFLVIAGKLLLIKSRALLPREPAPAADAGEEEDPAEELARRLREYRTFRHVARELAEIEARGERLYPREAPAPLPEIGPAPLAPMTPRMLLRALERLLLNAERQVAPDHVAGVPTPQPTVPETMAVIRARLAERPGGSVRFDDIVSGATTRREIVVAFLSLLELLKAGEITVHQSTLFGDIDIRAEAAPTPADPPSPTP